MNIFKQLFKTKRKLQSKLLHLKFLTRCKNANIVPKFLQINYKAYQKSMHKIIYQAEIKMLRLTIRNLRKSIQEIEIRAYYLHLKLSTFTSPLLLDFELRRIELIINKDILRIEKRHEKKFLYLLNQFHPKKDEPSIKSVPFINLSQKTLTQEEHNILNKGPKFAFNNKINIKKFIPEVETIIERIPAQHHEEIRGKFAFHLNKIINKSKQNMHKELKEIKILREIKNDNNIKVIQADKSQQIVLIDYSEYIIKIKNVLQDLRAIEIRKNPINSIITKTNKIIKNKNLIKPFDADIPLYPDIPKLFCKIKTHKMDLPLRPIVSKCNAPTYLLEKKLANFLKPLIENSEHVIKSGYQLIEKIQGIKLPKTAKLYSLDIISLFPSIPLDVTYNLIIAKCQIMTGFIPYINFIKEALNLIFTNNYFKIEGTIYKQSQGAPMGSPLSPLCAEILLQELEDQVLNNTKLKPTTYLRYVDDIFIIWPYRETSLLKFIDELNNVYPTIKFTYEKEKDKKLPFLDLLIHRSEEQNLWFDVYKKPTNKQIIIPANSAHPTAIKKLAFSAYCNRNIKYTTYKFKENKELKNIIKLGQEAGYKENFILKINNKIKNKNSNKFTTLSNGDDKNWKFTQSIQYHPSLLPLIKFIKRKFNLVIPFKSNTTIKNIVLNDRDSSTPTGGIYSIPIVINNETKYYIGKTKRTLDKRIKEHQNSLRSIYGHSALKEFVFNNPSTIVQWNRAKVIASPANMEQLNWREAIEITIKENNINIDPGRKIAKLWQTFLK